MDQEKQLEAEILAAFERDEWRAVPDTSGEIARFSAMASAALVKDKRVNIRISSRDWKIFKPKRLKRRFHIKL